MAEIDNNLSNESVRQDILSLRRQGWKVKFDHDEGTVVGFRANKKHVNLRGKRYKYSKGIRDLVGHSAWSYVKGWVFEIYTRNLNGGYIRNAQYAGLEEAIQAAIQLSEAPEPDLPTWDRAALPDPIPLPDNTTIYYKWSTGRQAEGHSRLHMEFERLIYKIDSIGVVAIASDCTVSLEAAMTPGNKAWFLFECWGTGGTFLIITDGDSLYPVKKIGRITSSKRGVDNRVLKISIDPQLRVADLRHLSPTDSKCIKLAVSRAADHWASQFAVAEDDQQP